MIADLIFKWFFGPFIFMAKLALWGVVLCFIALVVFLTCFDLNFFKSRVESVSSEFLQQQLKINGDVKLGMDGFHPSLVLHDVKIGEDGRTTVMLTDRFEVTLPFQKPDAQNPWAIFANLDNVRIDGRSLGDYELPVEIVANGIRIPKISGSIGDGDISGNAQLIGGILHADIKVTDGDYSQLSTGVTGGTVKADILLDGAYPYLDGHVRLMGGKGRMSGNALQFLAGDLLSAMLNNAQQDTQINCSIVDFKLQKGIARAKTLVFDTKDATIFGEGQIDFTKSYVDMRFTPKPKSRTLLTLATPVDVRGVFGQVTTTPDATSMAGKLGTMMLTTINPAAALLPLLEKGSGNPCAAYANAENK